MTPCREWHGPRNAGGYGCRSTRLSSQLVHRQVMELVHGPEAIAGKVVMHACDNPPCYRYDHLRIGTQQDNVDDKYAKGRGRKRLKSDSISFRQDPAVWDDFVAQAEQDGLTLPAYTETIVRRAVQQRKAQSR